MAIKLLHFLGRLVTQIFRIIAGFFRLLFKDIFFAILVKIYYQVFRLKKNDLALRVIKEIARNQLAYFFLTILTVGFIIANLTASAAAAGGQTTAISKTVLANLISPLSEVAPPETLVEDNSPAAGARNAGQSQYLDNYTTTLNKQNGLVTSNTAPVEPPLFNANGDLIYKPESGSLSLAEAPATAGTSNAAAPRTQITTYTVQTGDTVSSIGRQFGISVNTILWANNLTAYSLIRPGDILTILPYSGVLYTAVSGDTVSEIASRYGVDANEILSHNDLSGGLKIGQKIIVPGANPISAPVQVAASASTPSYTGISAIRNLITPTTPTPPPARVTGSGMLWPTVGHNITQYFSWHHPAIDIANHIGTPIYAAADGVVLIAQGGWNGGYGNTILLDNGNGMRTRYGHASRLLVSPGDHVKKGQVIALMGSTGNSTGPHLHFEVVINGAHYNPLNYVR